jgi:TrmH family RNA methyltransferase
MALVSRARIESRTNPRVKALVRLHTRRARERDGRALVEGAREVERALAAGVRIETAYLAPALLGPAGRQAESALERADVDIVDLSDDAFAKLSRRQNPDGVAAVIQPPRRALDDLDLTDPPLLLVAVSTEKPGNLGSLVRSADAAGVDAVLAVGGAGTDPWNPSAIRASMGSVFALPVVACDDAEARAWLARKGVRLVAAAPAAERELWEEDLTGPVAIALGPEHEGLSPAWTEAAEARVRVPMRGAADSLNVGVTGALLLYEAVRQRRGPADTAVRATASR